MDEAFEHIDLSYLNGNYPDNIPKRNKLLKLYLDSVPKELEELKTCLDAKDVEAINIKAHSIKTLMLHLGINPLFDKMLFIERNAKDKKHYNLVNTKFHEATNEWPLAAKEIEKAIKEAE